MIIMNKNGVTLFHNGKMSRYYRIDITGRIISLEWGYFNIKTKKESPVGYKTNLLPNKKEARSFFNKRINLKIAKGYK